MKPLTIRLFPEEGRTLFARVFVWPTKEAMYEHLPINRDHRGSCTPWERRRVDGDGKTISVDPCFAEINLFNDGTGSGVLTHELFHATMAWSRRVKFNICRVLDDDSVNEDEEKIAYVHSAMVIQLVDRLYKAGVIA